MRRRDGLKDGLIDDPTKCDFDPEVLLCKGADGPDVPDRAAGEGGEEDLFARRQPAHRKRAVFVAGAGHRTRLGLFRRSVRNLRPTSTISIATSCSKIPSGTGRRSTSTAMSLAATVPENLIMNATDPNMKPFFAHGGKLLLYHGWSDPNVPTLNTIKYYNERRRHDGRRGQGVDNVRLFLAPGMGHCGGGEGPNVFDKVGPLEQWVEQGKAPEQLIASHSTERQSGSHASAVPVSAGREIQGHGQHRRSRQFRVPCAVDGGAAASHLHARSMKT